MQVRPGRAAGIPDQPDDLAALYFLSDGDDRLRLVRIGRVYAPTMVNNRVKPMNRKLGTEEDFPVRGGVDIDIICGPNAEVKPCVVIFVIGIIVRPSVSETRRNIWLVNRVGHSRSPLPDRRRLGHAFERLSVNIVAVIFESSGVDAGNDLVGKQARLTVCAPI